MAARGKALMITIAGVVAVLAAVSVQVVVLICKKLTFSGVIMTNQ